MMPANPDMHKKPVMRLIDLYDESPRKALEKVLDDAAARSGRGQAFLSCCVIGLDGTGYSSFRHVDRKTLEGREFQVEFRDGNVTITFTDVRHDPRTGKDVPVHLVKDPVVVPPPIHPVRSEFDDYHHRLDACSSGPK
jgi:hypothetical protein